jgi:hypothetical protein
MSGKKSMPPELLAHFKKKNEESEPGGKVKESDKTRRKEAVKKARVRLEEKSRRPRRDQEKEAGKESHEAS